MRFVCLDTMILIWAIRGYAKEGQEEMIDRAKALIDRLQKADMQILIPSVVLGEFLVGVPEPDRAKVMQTIQRDFMVATYDGRSAILYAQLYPRNANILIPGTTRQELKADRLIIATAVVNQAERIYSHDTGLIAMAEHIIEVCDVPQVPAQRNLPGL